MNREFFCQGTLGDTYIFCCKLIALGFDPIKLFHRTAHKYWYQEIHEIYKLLPNIDVHFTEKDYPDLIEITSNTHEQEMNFFPNFDWSNVGITDITSMNNNYLVIQPESGKPKGFNHKELKPKIVQEKIYQSELPVVVLGTSSRYKYLKCAYNLIGETSITEAMYIVSKASKFIGPEGLLSFVALSHKVNSEIYFKSYDAVFNRIVDTPWDGYCEELIFINIF